MTWQAAVASSGAEPLVIHPEYHLLHFVGPQPVRLKHQRGQEVKQPEGLADVPHSRS
jgi:hypothetical protein